MTTELSTDAGEASVSREWDSWCLGDLAAAMGRLQTVLGNQFSTAVLQLVAPTRPGPPLVVHVNTESRWDFDAIRDRLSACEWPVGFGACSENGFVVEVNDLSVFVWCLDQENR